MNSGDAGRQAPEACGGMGNVQLIRLSPALEQALANDAEYMDALAQDDWARVAGCVQRVVGRKLFATPEIVNELHWGGYLAVDEGSREVVGSCAFKAPPGEEGEVEIAYFTYPGFEGRGYATGMARELIKRGRAAAARRVTAHTLPEASASTRVLEKVGMDFAGEVLDAEDGRVWRWQLQLDRTGENQP